MRGECVTVYSYAAQGEDEHGDVVETSTAHVASDVLVLPLDGRDKAEIDRMDSIMAEYSLVFPKSYDGPELRGCRVALTDRGMGESEALYVIGKPDVVAQSPNRWNMTAKVGRSHG